MSQQQFYETVQREEEYQMELKLWLKYDDGREYTEYVRPSVVPEYQKLASLRDNARRAGNRVIESHWEYVETADGGEIYEQR